MMNLVPWPCCLLSSCRRNMDRLIDFLMGDSKNKLVFCWVISVSNLYFLFSKLPFNLHGKNWPWVSLSKFDVCLTGTKVVKVFFLGIYVLLPSFILPYHSQFNVTFICCNWLHFMKFLYLLLEAVILVTYGICEFFNFFLLVFVSMLWSK